MKVLGTLKRLNAKSLWQLLSLCVRNPLFLHPTFLATKECMHISTLHYGREHYRNTPANAFRHAFWNYLIASSCAKWSNNPSKVLQWTKAITDWHENAFVNRELPRLMDLHNNEIGRTIYVYHSAEHFETIIELLRTKTRNALQVKNAEAIALAPDKLVYLYPTSNTFE